MHALIDYIHEEDSNKSWLLFNEYSYVTVGRVHDTGGWTAGRTRGIPPVAHIHRIVEEVLSKPSEKL